MSEHVSMRSPALLQTETLKVNPKKGTFQPRCLKITEIRSSVKCLQSAPATFRNNCAHAVIQGDLFQESKIGSTTEN